MRTETVIVRHGENVGPVDWSHPTAKDMPAIWREAEKNPQGFTFSEYQREIISICMYDGWPYWEPTPAVCFVGPLNSAEWSFFNSYGVGPESIQPKAVQCERCQGNGEIVTDWDRYLHALPVDVGDEAVAECPDCDGMGRA